MVFLLKLFFNGLNFIAISLDIYFIFLAQETNNYVALTFLIYLLGILIFPWLYKSYRFVFKVNNFSLTKFVFLYFSYISFSTLFFIIVQWYVIDNIRLNNFYRTIQQNFTQAYQSK